VILFCDEDVGTRVPRALSLIGLPVVTMADREWRGKNDIEWLTAVGREGLLVFSCNKRILNVPLQRETLIAEKVGIVFLTSGQERLHQVLQLLLTKWEWLEEIDAAVERPFAYYLYPSGSTRRVL